MIEEEQLESRVQMVGPVPHEQARDVLVCLILPELLSCCAVPCFAA